MGRNIVETIVGGLVLVVAALFYWQRRIVTKVSAQARALRESEERFRLLVEGVSDYAILMLDPLGLVVSWNEGARYLKGYTDGREARAREIVTELEQFRSLFASQAAGRNVSPLPVRV